MIIIPLFVAAVLTKRIPPTNHMNNLEQRIESLVKKMTLDEKLGQMSQVGLPDHVSPEFKEALRSGKIGSVLGWGRPEIRAEIQQIAMKESRLGIPLIMGHDVIHGYTVGWPIPLGQAATWNPDLIEYASRQTAKEATADGIHWTFSPMLDIARDPRWGRIAEGYGEDPILTSAMGVATVRGYQGASLNDPNSLAACAKHYVGYGAAEAGRDYNSTWIPEGLLRDVYLKPFRAVANVGIASYMSSFNAINGVPASANPLTLRQILRKEWKFDGFVVSDYMSVHELIEHGVAENGSEAAKKAIKAGVDMEMVSDDYVKYGPDLVATGKLDPKVIDESVKNILRVKFRLGLFDGRVQRPLSGKGKPSIEALALGRKIATESGVLLKNNRRALPIKPTVAKIAVIGPLADSPADQLGTWANADPRYSVTPLADLRARLGDERVLYAPGLTINSTGSRSSQSELDKVLLSNSQFGFGPAVEVGGKADVILIFLGESANMSGEARSRSNLDLPGVQAELVAELAKLGKPMIGVIMAGRPLTFHETAEKLDAVLYAWHGGTMAGPAIVDLLFGDVVPSGKLPVSFPRSVGQIPLYYDHLNTGRPPATTGPAAIDPFRSKYLDVEFTPEYPFGYGLSYTNFVYGNEYSSAKKMGTSGSVTFSAVITNTGKVEADEIVQFYTHQIAASISRPVRELKAFQKVRLKAGESRTVTFVLSAIDLSFTDAHMKDVIEPGVFEAWIAPDSTSGVKFVFEVVQK